MGVVAPNNNADARAAASPADRPKYVLFPASGIRHTIRHRRRVCPWGSTGRSEYPDGRGILRSPNRQKKPIELRHPKRRPRTCRRGKMRDSHEIIPLHGEYIEKTVAATDVNQTALCIHEQVIGVAASLNSVRHSTAAKLECSEFRWMPKHGHDLLTLRIDREREVGA